MDKLRCALTLLILLAPSLREAKAVIVDRLAGPFDVEPGEMFTASTPVNTSAPKRDTQFDQTGVEDDDPTTVIGGDPGWRNVPVDASAIYLGNQWLLGARHALREDIRTQINGNNYREIAGTRTIIQNPTRFRGITLTDDSDLVLVRLSRSTNLSNPGVTPEEDSPLIRTLNNPDPDRRLTLASGSHSFNDDVLKIGRGLERVVNPTDPQGHTDFSILTDNGLGIEAWDPVDLNAITPPDEPPPTLRGFQVGSRAQRTWGVNRVGPDSDIEQNAAGNPVFDSNNDLVVEVSGRTQVVQLTRFDPGLGEAQGVPGDSGGPVFVRNSANEWELGGIMHAISSFNTQTNNTVTIDGVEHTILVNQPTRDVTLFGRHTFFTDIGNPLTTYRNQILELYNLDFSIAGDDLTGDVDVNLDGVIDMDDLDALASGWTAEQTDAGLTTWRRGDINQDGDTDLADFALLRDALGGGVGLTELNAALAAASVSVAAIPEPAAAWLIAVGLAGVLARRGPRIG